MGNCISEEKKARSKTSKNKGPTPEKILHH